MDYVLDNLAIGDSAEALHPPAGIDALLCVAEEKDLPEPGRPYRKVPIRDMQPIPPEQLREAVEWIRDTIGGRRIMVFCNAGVGRSPSVAVAYLCCVRGFSFGRAVEHVATRRPRMSTLPNLIRSIAEANEAMGTTEERPGDRKASAIEFLRLAAKGNAREAFRRHVGPAFRHHNPYFRGDARSLMCAMEENASRNPDKILGIRRALQDGELVAVHSRVRQRPGDRGGAVVHIFRFEGNLIAEFWDVGQAEPEDSPNECGMF